MYLGPNEFEPNVFEGRADRSSRAKRSVVVLLANQGEFFGDE